MAGGARSHARRPLALHLLSAEKWLKHKLGRGPRLTVDRIREIAAMASGGLTDAGDPYHVEGLEVVLESARDADLTWAGRHIVEQMVWSAYTRRLFLTDHQTRHPDQRHDTLRAPFMIVGMARTGTTHLHRLLSLDPAFHGPALWELLRPFPPADGDDQRRELTWVEFERSQRRRGGQAEHIHYNDPDTPEECTILLMSTFASSMYYAAAPLDGLLEWGRVRAHELLDHAYDDYRQFLLAIQAEHPEQALALKSPTHFPALGPISRQVPEARLIHTVRHPRSWVVSADSLVHAGHAMTARRPDPHAIGATNHAMMEEAWEIHRRDREQTGVDIIDVFYDDIVVKPIEVVRSIYTHFGVDWPDGHEQRLQTYLDANPSSKRGEHVYRASDFGTSDGEITERFRGYIDYFGLS